MLIARLRVLLARRPWIYWAAIAVVVALVASSAWAAAERVEAARRSWGEERTAWVARGRIRPGAVIQAEARLLPTAAVPAGALDEDPTGRTALQHVGDGEVVTDVDVGDGSDGPLALLPPRWEAVAVPTDPARLPAAPGDHVAIYSHGERLSADGIVLEALDGVVTVAVAPGDAAAVALAAREQSAVLSLRGP